MMKNEPTADLLPSAPLAPNGMLSADSPIIVNMNCTVGQLSLIMHSLDLFMRLGIGQMEHVLEHWGVEEYLGNKFRKQGKVDWDGLHEEQDVLKNLLHDVKRILFNAPTNGSHGIGSVEVSDLNREAYDMVQVIRHELYKLRGEKQTMTVDAFPAMRFSTKTDLVKVAVVCR